MNRFVYIAIMGWVLSVILLVIFGVDKHVKQPPETQLCQSKFGTGHGTVIIEKHKKLQYKKTKPSRIIIICEGK